VGEGWRWGHVSILKRPEARGRCSHDGAWARAAVAESEQNGRERLDVEEGRRHVGPARQRQREGATVAHADWAGPARKTGGGKGKARGPRGKGPMGRK
jgi:hypothetical protein